MRQRLHSHIPIRSSLQTSSPARVVRKGSRRLPSKLPGGKANIRIIAFYIYLFLVWLVIILLIFIIAVSAESGSPPGAATEGNGDV
jgi:hypothetical protein